MHFGLPVISFDSSALPETIGAGGILVKEKHHPEIAELMFEVHANQEFRSQLVAAGRKRVEELDVSHFARHVAEIFARSPKVAVLRAKA
jgi:glycosyltransferase involved in cell wall biosynthesis